MTLTHESPGLPEGYVVAPQALEPAASPAPTASRWQRLIRGNDGDPTWVRPSLLALLFGTAVLYIWGLSASGWANAFYSAAVQAGTQSWKAMFFGSSDAANFITVDKPPASLWVMEISARIFGVNSWSILVPQALEGVAAVGLLYVTVRRWFTPAAGLLAGAVLALTPVAALMFRFNNPDALLVLLLVVAAYATTRAIEHASVRWLAAVGVLIGFAFLTKSLQAFLVVPGFALAYLIAAPVGFLRRIRDLLIAGAVLVVSGGWWVAIVDLWPAGSRPYIGGSQNNHAWELILGYNGVGRLSGNENGSVVGNGAQGQAGQWGETGWGRLFSSSYGGQIAWLIPAALIAIVALLWFTRKNPRTNRTRAAVVIWGGWLLVTGLTISFAQGIIHEYYTVALAPAIGALVGIGAVKLWSARRAWVPRIVLAAAILVTAWWSYVLLGRSASWHPELRALVVVGGIAGAGLILAGQYLNRRIAAGVAIGTAAVMLIGPAAYAVETAGQAHEGSLPSAGPAVAGARGGPGGGGMRGGPGGQGMRTFQGQQGQGQQGQGFGQGGPPQMGQGFNQGTPLQFGQGGGMPGGGMGGGTGGAAGGGAAGGLLNGSAPSSEVTALLQANADQYTWVAAAVGSNSASGYQLASGEPVMAIGGFNGTDPSITLAKFQEYVNAGRIHYFISGGGNAGRGSSNEIASWVTSNFTATTSGGVTLYDLTQPTSPSSADVGTTASDV